jgi:hypothetical protein
MLVRRLSAGALCFLASVTIISGRVSSETGDKQLARVKGVVGYQASATGDFKPIFGRLDLPDDAFAVTKPNASAVLRLKDSSEIDIGENTKVQVGQFNAAESGSSNTINLQGGALHFNIRHPQGGQSNYKFVTATSQIAVRGTEGFLIAGVNGTQVVCVSCAAGDVSVQVGQQTVSIVSNQTLTVLGTNPLSATTSITTNPSVNNPAINQFNNNSNPFSTTTTSTTSLDPTGSLSGGGTGAATAGIGGAATAVGAAAGAAAIVATVAKPGDNPSPAPTTGPTNPPLNLPGTLVVQINYAGASTFPQPFSWPFSQLNATSTATFTCAPASIITCTPQQAVSNGTLNGTLAGQLLSAGAFTVGGSANGYVLSPTTFTVYGAVSASPSVVSFINVALPASQTVTVTQAAATSINATINCPGGANAANITLIGANGPSPLTFTVTANSAPNVAQAPGLPPACTITVHGQGDGAASSVTIPVNDYSTNVNITSHRRKTN